MQKIRGENELKLVAAGAEARLYECVFQGAAALRKVRERKKYRAYALDARLRALRTKKEAKVLHAAKLAGVKCPLLLHADVERFELFEELIPNAVLLREKLGALPGGGQKALGQCGEMLAAMHCAGLVHGDFTSSNVMLGRGGEVFFIDFGLADFSCSIEGQATDLLLFKKSVSERQFGFFLAGYAKANTDARLVEGRLGEILQRGRYVARQGALGSGNGEARGGENERI